MPCSLQAGFLSLSALTHNTCYCAKAEADDAEKHYLRRAHSWGLGLYSMWTGQVFTVSHLVVSHFSLGHFFCFSQFSFLHFSLGQVWGSAVAIAVMAIATIAIINIFFIVFVFCLFICLCFCLCLCYRYRRLVEPYRAVRLKRTNEQGTLCCWSIRCLKVCQAHQRKIRCGAPAVCKLLIFR